VLLKIEPAHDIQPFHDFVVVVAVFPAMVYLAMRCQPSPFISRICVFLGAISYGIYVLHYPAKELLDRIFALSGHGGFLLRHAPWTGVVFVAALVPLCWFIDRVYDAPVRRALLAAQRRKKAANASADVAGP
jgi:peptidoglycan/LPS O-acetylase OafA/YrhL